MSLNTKRQEIADAASTVDGLTGYKTRPTVIKAGAVWATLDTLEHGPGGAFAATWKVWVCLGGDELAAYDLLDKWLEDVIYALSTSVYIDPATPVAIATTGGDMFAATLTGKAEM